MPVRLFAGEVPRIEPAECQPVHANTQQGASAYRLYARTDALVSGHGDYVEVAPVAYDAGDARKALADLRGALARCRSFTMPLDRTEHSEPPGCCRTRTWVTRPASTPSGRSAMAMRAAGRVLPP